MLESAGIESFLIDENMARLETAFAIGIRLRVKPGDAETAMEVLDQQVPDEPEEEEE